jgi:hypothetical protein
MAAPLAHIFLALQMLMGPWKDRFDHKKFIIGTSFPDIRYLKCVERGSTHVSQVSLEDIAQESGSFRAGLLFHSLVDLRREDFFKKHNLYDRFAHSRFTSHAIKFAEDELLRPHYDTHAIRNYFNDILDEERAYGIPEDTIRTWHTFIQKYTDGGWSSQDILMNYFDLNMPHAWFFQRWYFWWLYARPAERVIEQVRADVDMKAKILDFYLRFAEIAQTSSH